MSGCGDIEEGIIIIITIIIIMTCRLTGVFPL